MAAIYKTSGSVLDLVPDEITSKSIAKRIASSLIYDIVGDLLKNSYEICSLLYVPVSTASTRMFKKFVYFHK